MAKPSGGAITTPRPHFTWIVPLTRSNDLQTAYQIQVFSMKPGHHQEMEMYWDSGRVDSSNSIHLPYHGPELLPGHTHSWRVRTWNRHGKPSLWSYAQEFLIETSKDRSQEDSALDSRQTVIPYRLQENRVAPIHLVKLNPGHFFADFGQAAFGTLEIRVRSKEAGQKMTVHLGERLDGKDRVHRNPGGSIRYRRMEVPLLPGPHVYRIEIAKDKRNTGPGAILMPSETGEVLPFRYCEIEGLPSRPWKSNVNQVRVHYPFDDHASMFRSSDPVLNDIWELCKYTIKATSFCGVYVDGDRERIPYEADAYINQLGHYATDREFTLARYSHEYLILHPTWPTEWALHSPLMAWADFLHTGNLASAREFYPDLKEKILIGLAREDGLISSRSENAKNLYERLHMNHSRYIHGRKLVDIVDWPAGERDGYVFTDINTVVNAFHYKALLCMEGLSEALGRNKDAELYRARAELVYTSFNAKLLDPGTGLYVDGEGTEHSSLHSNMFPLAFGLVPKERVKPIAKFLKDKGMVCSVYGAQYLLEALYEAEEGEACHHLMTNMETDRSWPHMLYQVGTTITLEAWDDRYKPNQDWNHAWGAAPANIIPRKLMGIEPLEPGFRRVRIRPQLGPLRWAEMTLPTLMGSVKVRVERKGDHVSRMELFLPANMTGEVHFPVAEGEKHRLFLDGKTVEAHLQGNFLIVDNVQSGFHRLILRP